MHAQQSEQIRSFVTWPQKTVHQFVKCDLTAMLNVQNVCIANSNTCDLTRGHWQFWFKATRVAQYHVSREAEPNPKGSRAAHGRRRCCAPRHRPWPSWAIPATYACTAANNNNGNKKPPAQHARPCVGTATGGCTPIGSPEARTAIEIHTTGPGAPARGHIAAACTHRHQPMESLKSARVIEARNQNANQI